MLNELESGKAKNARDCSWNSDIRDGVWYSTRWPRSSSNVTTEKHLTQLFDSILIIGSGVEVEVKR